MRRADAGMFKMMLVLCLNKETSLIVGKHFLKMTEVSERVFCVQMLVFISPKSRQLGQKHTRPTSLDTPQAVNGDQMLE